MICNAVFVTDILFDQLNDISIDQRRNSLYSFDFERKRKKLNSNNINDNSNLTVKKQCIFFAKTIQHLTTNNEQKNSTMKFLISNCVIERKI